MEVADLPADLVAELNRITGGCKVTLLSERDPEIGGEWRYVAVHFSWGPPSWHLAYALVVPSFALERPLDFKPLLDRAIEHFRRDVEGCAERVWAAAMKKKPRKTRKAQQTASANP